MGWEKGQGIGRSSQGNPDPIQVKANIESRGKLICILRETSLNYFSSFTVQLFDVSYSKIHVTQCLPVNLENSVLFPT